jgi:hypothetical protein
VLSALLQLLGLALVGLTLFLAWPPLLAAYVGVLLVGAVEVRSRR